MGKPFSDLEKQVMAILRSGGDPAASQDKGIQNYWKWRLDPTDVSHDLPAASERPNGRKLLDVGVKPFGLEVPANVYATVTISERSDTQLKSNYGAFGVKVLTATDLSYRLKGFVPARVYARTGGSGEAQPRVSRITKRPYKSKFTESDQGYSSPFGVGSGDGEDVYEGQVAAIEPVLVGEGKTYSYATFSPEKVGR